jgi:hypothetical protein
MLTHFGPPLAGSAGRCAILPGPTGTVDAIVFRKQKR